MSKKGFFVPSAPIDVFSINADVKEPVPGSADATGIPGMPTFYERENIRYPGDEIGYTAPDVWHISPQISNIPYNDIIPKIPRQGYNVFSDEEKHLIAEDNAISDVQHQMPQMLAEFLKIQALQLETFCKKQLDYGPGNIALDGNPNENDDDRMGSLRGIVIRMNDKIQRLVNLVVKNQSTQNESIEDSFLDVSVYGIIALIVSKRRWGI